MSPRSKDMSYESSSFSRSSSSSEGGFGKRRRKVRKKRRKTMTAADMRKGVTFQTGLTGKAKLALTAVILAGIAITVVVMMAVNGSFSLKGLEGDSSGSFDLQEGSSLDAFGPDKGEEGALTVLPSEPVPAGQPPAALPVDDISKAFEE